MATLTNMNPLPFYGNPEKIEGPAVGAGTFYAGALVFADASSGLYQTGNAATLAAGDRFIGIVAETTVVTAANQLVPVYVGGVFGFKVGSTDAADIGLVACIDSSSITDNPDDVKVTTDITEAANDVAIGTVVSFHNSRAWVALGRYYPRYDTLTTTAGFRLNADA